MGVLAPSSPIGPQVQRSPQSGRDGINQAQAPSFCRPNGEAGQFGADRLGQMRGHNPFFKASRGATLLCPVTACGLHTGFGPTRPRDDLAACDIALVLPKRRQTKRLEVVPPKAWRVFWVAAWHRVTSKSTTTARPVRSPSAPGPRLHQRRPCPPPRKAVRARAATSGDVGDRFAS